MNIGKNQFYNKVRESLESKGYEYYDGDNDIIGKGRQHANKPDYIAVKSNMVFIGEIKSPAEGPKTASWRQVQNSDTEQFADVRRDVAKREKNGLLLPEIGGHEIIISGQIADYIKKIGITYDLPSSIPPSCKIMMAYTLPEFEESNVEQALANCRKKIFEKVKTGDGTITFFYK